MKASKLAWLNFAGSGAQPQPPAVTPLFIATGIFNIIVPLFFAVFAWKYAAAFVHTVRISNLIILGKTVLDLHFYVRKTTAIFIRTSAYAWLIALCGTVIPLMFRPSDEPSDFWIATMIQVIGLAMQIYVIRTLNRSSGAEVAGRSIKRSSLHGLVRHPLYLTFMISQFGYVLNQTTLYNLCILVLVTFFQVLRINEEERLLLEDEAYQDYKERTPWKVIPCVF
jgi:protein-S-isoprenylcysteine O-methyltransferase Ste14